MTDSKLFFVLDTGAAASILDRCAFEHLVEGGCALSLQKCARQFHAVNGTPLPVYGEVDLSMKIGGSCFRHTFVVTDMPGWPGIIGVDFLDKTNSRIDVRSGMVWLGDVQVQCTRVEDSGVRIMCVRKRTIIFPGRELRVRLMGTLVNGNRGKMVAHSGPVLVEPIPGIWERYGCFAATVVTESQGKSCTISLANMGESTVIIPQGTFIGFAYPVCSVNKFDSAVRQPETHVKCVVESTTGDLKQDSKSTRDATAQGVSQQTDHVQPLLDRVKDELSKEDYALAKNLIYSYSDIFARPGEPLGRTDMVEHEILTGDHHPLRDKMRRYSPRQMEAIDKEVDKMIEQDVVVPSCSPWSSAIVVATKKDGTPRVCLDMRRLNNITKKDAYPLPRIDHALASLSGAKYYCTLDLLSGYWQVPLSAKDQEKTAFSVPRRGHFQFKVMPFGLCNAPATFERLMEQILRGLQWETCLVYLDDIIIMGKTVEEVVANLDQVLARLRAAGLKLKPSKCNLFAKEVIYLGHIVSEKGIACDPEKVSCVKEWPVPQNINDI